MSPFKKLTNNIQEIDDILKINPIFQPMAIGLGFQQLTNIIAQNQKEKSERMLTIIEKALTYFKSGITFPAFSPNQKIEMINNLEKQKNKIKKKLKKKN